MILFIDNYDSFVYNLARYVTQLGYATQVIRNDAISVADVIALAPEKIIISPGPCAPDQAGVSLALVTELQGKIPILGVCLGHQVIGQAYGGKIVRAQQPMHGKAAYVDHRGEAVFSGLPSPLKVGCYYSLVVAKENLPEQLHALANSDSGEIMALRHQTQPVFGVQFHPESVNTEMGYELLNNFLTGTS